MKILQKILDSNLELGMALSASLRESEVENKLRETENLLEAGLEQEAMFQCKHLEDFGFISSKSVDLESQKSNVSFFFYAFFIIVFATEAKRI